MAIYDAIAASPSPITLLAYAHARSMSSIIPQAAKKRVIMPNADFMVHFGTAAYEGDARSFLAEAKQNDRLDGQMLDIYTSKCYRGPSSAGTNTPRTRVREYLRQRMNEVREWYMPAAEAVDKGFMDGVFGTPGFRTLDEIRPR